MDIKIHNIGGYIVKNYLLETPQGIIAIDTGYAGGCEAFVRRFQKRWPLAALSHIFITHHHDDHVGFLDDLLRVCDAQVLVHPLTVDLLAQGRNNEPPGSGYSSVPASWFGRVKKDFTYPPVQLGARALIIADETQQVFEAMGLPVKIVFLPGHTVDSMGLFLPQSGQLFCGDAAMNAVISVAKHTIWIDDAGAFQQTWDKMLALQPRRIYPAHGTPFHPKALVKHRHFLDGKTLIRPGGRG